MEAGRLGALDISHVKCVVDVVFEYDTRLGAGDVVRPKLVEPVGRGSGGRIRQDSSEVVVVCRHPRACVVIEEISLATCRAQIMGTFSAGWRAAPDA